MLIGVHSWLSYSRGTTKSRQAIHHLMNRTFFPLGVLALTFLLGLSTAQTKEPNEHPAETSVTPDDALSRLTKGNKRFATGRLVHPRQNSERRAKLAQSQAPFAIVLACADSRVAPELTFDQGLGDLFVVRVAGNLVNDEGLGSIEYAVEHLGARLIVVLGHERCGAVQAARDTIASGQAAPAHIDSLVTAIKPAVDTTAGADLEATVKANVENVVKKLETSEPVLKPLIEKKQVVVKAAYYDLDTGAVTFLDSK